MAYCYFTDDAPLHEKIIRVLDEWLRFVGVQRNEARYYIEDSDDDN